MNLERQIDGQSGKEDIFCNTEAEWDKEKGLDGGDI